MELRTVDVGVRIGILMVMFCILGYVIYYHDDFQGKACNVCTAQQIQEVKQNRFNLTLPEVFGDEKESVENITVSLP